jgi:hypothetical protein
MSTQPKTFSGARANTWPPLLTDRTPRLFILSTGGAYDNLGVFIFFVTLRTSARNERRAEKAPLAAVNPTVDKVLTPGARLRDAIEIPGNSPSS